MAIVGYWAIGAPVGVGLAFFTPLQGRGLWIGLACGLAATSLLLLVRWRGAERSGFPHTTGATSAPAEPRRSTVRAD
jgi:MATE family multidrug resistance protein